MVESGGRRDSKPGSRETTISREQVTEQQGKKSEKGQLRREGGNQEGVMPRTQRKGSISRRSELSVSTRVERSNRMKTEKSSLHMEKRLTLAGVVQRHEGDRRREGLAEA